jgi:hypothetical protein
MPNDEHVKLLKQGADAWNKWRVENPNIRPDLSEADLIEANLYGAYLNVANLRDAVLSEADLGRANLNGADLRGANLRGADLWEAHLTDANLSDAVLSKAKLDGANLRGANLRGADFGGANLSGADLRSAVLSEADLSRANLNGADLRGANLRGANLGGADLDGAVLVDTDLRGAQAEKEQLGWQYDALMDARQELYRVLDALPLRAAVPRESLSLFIYKQSEEFPKYHPDIIRARKTTWRGKVEPDIWPNMTEAQLDDKLIEAADNPQIKNEVRLWELIEAIGDSNLYGRITIEPSKEGRVIRMIGLNPLAKGWNVLTLILDATGDRGLLEPVFRQVEEPDPRGWQQLARPASVRLRQCLDRTFSKEAIAPEGKDKERKADAAWQVYAGVLANSLEYGGSDAGVIVYKSTEDWIKKNCVVPDWIKFAHWGDVTGSNALREVRALYVIGRPLPKDEVMTLQAEALFGERIQERNYIEREHGGVIPVVPTPSGDTCAHVSVRTHPHPMAERLRRQIVEGSIIHAVGRARAGSRKDNEPLDIHLWTNVPVPELGPVEPVFGDDIEVGPDALMLAAEGVWLENTADAARAFPKLFTANALRLARSRAGTGVSTHDFQALRKTIFLVTYQRAAVGCKETSAVFLRRCLPAAAPREWLEERLGPLTTFEIVW